MRNHQGLIRNSKDFALEGSEFVSKERTFKDFVDLKNRFLSIWTLFHISGTFWKGSVKHLFFLDCSGTRFTSELEPILQNRLKEISRFTCTSSQVLVKNEFYKFLITILFLVKYIQGKFKLFYSNNRILPKLNFVFFNFSIYFNRKIFYLLGSTMKPMSLEINLSTYLIDIFV